MLLTLTFVVSAFAGCGSSDDLKKESDDEMTIMPAPVDDPEKGTGDEMVHILSDEVDASERFLHLKEDKVSTGKATGTADLRNMDSTDALKIFSYDLFKQVSNEKNPIVSPVSAYLALAMAGAGADGASKEEFERIFGSDFLKTAKQFYTRYNINRSDLIFTTSDAAWISKKVKTKKDWINDLDVYFDAKTKSMDLTKKAVVRDINKWVNAKTNGLIKEMVNKPFSKDTMMALFNAIYFKGEWVNEFKAENTYKDEFTLEGGKTVKVDMMHGHAEHLLYIANNECTGTVLPYKSGNLAMLALKPNSDMSAREFLNKIDAEYIRDAFDGSETREVILRLPKFTVDFDRELNNDLKALGFDTIFNGSEADFSKAFTKTSEVPALFISLVKQKAKIIVDEKGTEAAAVTMVTADCGAALVEEPPVEMFFDEPFVYMIIDTENQVPLFMGILDKPNT